MKRNIIRTTVAAVLTSMILAGCGSVRFIANGDEFQKICTSNGLQVQDAAGTVKAEGDYKSLKDAYLATAEDGTYSVWYVRFGDVDEARSYYDSVADQMDGTTYSGSNYTAEVETLGTESREIYMESGRIIYADGDTAAITTLEKQLTGTWAGAFSDAGASSGKAAADSEESNADVTLQASDLQDLQE